jgi:hypothetical protein
LPATAHDRLRINNVHGTGSWQLRRFGQESRCRQAPVFALVAGMRPKFERRERCVAAVLHRECHSLATFSKRGHTEAKSSRRSLESLRGLCHISAFDRGTVLESPD